MHCIAKKGGWENKNRTVKQKVGAAVVQASNPNDSGGQGRRITGAHEFNTGLGNIGRSYLYKKNEIRLH